MAGIHKHAAATNIEVVAEFAFAFATGAETGVARLVEVSMVKVVDIGAV